MESILKFFNQPLPASFILLVVIIVGIIEIKDLKRRLELIEKAFRGQVKWCMEHFRQKNEKGGE